MLSSTRKFVKPLLAAGGVLCLSTTALAMHHEGEMAVKVGGVYIVPDDSSVEWTGPDGESAKAKLKEDTNPFSASIDLLVMATDEIGVNFGTIWPAKVKQKTTADDGTRGEYEYRMWPWHVTAQYYFMTPQDMFRPYVGAGLHYTNLDKFKIDHQSIDKVELDNEYGFLLQVGGIYNIDDSMFVDFSARYFYLEPDGKTKVRIDDETVRGKVKDYKINPWMFNISFGFKF